MSLEESKGRQIVHAVRLLLIRLRALLKMWDRTAIPVHWPRMERSLTHRGTETGRLSSRVRLPLLTIPLSVQELTPRTRSR
jgi:hypothetical protein